MIGQRLFPVIGSSDRLTLRQAADRLGFLDSSPLRRAITSGKLEAEKIGRDWLVTPDALDAYVEQHKPQPRGPRQTPKRRRCDG